MKIRTAKKIMSFGPNHRRNKHQDRRFEELRPAYVNEQGRKVYPSWHDIDIISRAHTRLFRWIRRYENKQSKLKNVSLEVAKLLKEKGFDSHYSTHFYKNNKLECYIEDRKKYWLQKDEYAAPTLYMAQKWLRETKNIHIDVYRNAGGWLYNLTKADNGTLITEGKSLGPNNGKSWGTYEEVLCAGILYALKSI